MDSAPLIERANRPHRLDFLRAVTEQSSQHLIGMLSERRCRRFHFAHSLTHPPRDSAMLPLTHFRMLAINEVLALAQMRILRYVLAVRARRRCDARLLQLRDYVGDAPARSPFGDYRLERVFILLARRERLEARVIGQLSAADCARETRPLRIVGTCDRQPLIDRQ